MIFGLKPGSVKSTESRDKPRPAMVLQRSEGVRAYVSQAAQPNGTAAATPKQNPGSAVHLHGALESAQETKRNTF